MPRSNRFLALQLVLLCIAASVQVSFCWKGWCAPTLRRVATHSLAGAVAIAFGATQSIAVSGGGKDFASKDLKYEDMSNQNLMGKDFTQCGEHHVLFLLISVSLT